MKKLKGWLVLGGLALLVTAALADYNVSNHGTHYENASSGQRVTSFGHLTTSEQADLGTQQSGWLTLISDTMAIGGPGDSCGVQTAYSGYVLHGFGITASLPAAGGTGFVRIALSIRTHLNDTADSTSTLPVMWDRQAIQAAGGADSLAFGQNVAETSVAFNEYEVIVTLFRQATGSTKYTGRYIPIETIAGNTLRLKNFSVKARVLSAAANTNAVTVTAYCTMLR